jgi:hypothetical protein
MFVSLSLCCQVNAIDTAQPIDGFIPFLLSHDLGARHLLLFTECPLAKLALVNLSRQVSTESEQISYDAVNRKKALSLPSRTEATHLSLPLASRLM